jgi:hypothetical protein
MARILKTSIASRTTIVPYDEGNGAVGSGDPSGDNL